MDSIDRREMHGKLYEGEEGCAELVVSGGDASELLQFVEEALDVVALAIYGLSDRSAPVPGCSARPICATINWVHDLVFNR